MFSSKLSRAAHRATTAAHPAPGPVRATGPRHQRRHSSSKASSWPPDPSAREPISTSKTSQKQTKTKTKGASKKVAEKAAEPVDQFAGLPSVPLISGMRLEDLTLSKFFSLHRPVSITTTIPPPSTPEAFSSLFTTRPTQHPWANGNSAERRPEEVIYMLQNTVEALENSKGNAEDEGMRWEVVHASPSNAEGGVKHLDAVPQIKSIDELVAQFRPFKAPPPPVPFTGETQQQAAPEKKANTTRSTSKGRPRKKTYTATITVTESTDASGETTFFTSSSPIVQLRDTEDSTVVDTAIREPNKIRSPFRTRMQQRQRANVTDRANNTSITNSQSPPIRRAPSAARQGRIHNMFLISVKRQRKLKMKKHKYKKLMKRTRTLRRKLDRT